MKIESNLVNQLNHILSREFGFKPFEIKYRELLKEDIYSTLEIRLFYKPLNVCITHAEYSFRSDNPHSIKNKLLETFERCLLTDIIFGLPINGEILDTHGDRIYNFADIKQHLLDNYGK